MAPIALRRSSTTARTFAVIEHRRARGHGDAEQPVHRQPDEESGALHRHIVRQARVQPIEQPRVQKSEQQPVCEQLHHGQAQETEEKHPTGGEEPERPSRAVASKAIDDSAGQENPKQDVDGGRANNHSRPAGPVDKGAQVVENGAESDDRGLERDADARGLVAELLHPVVVDTSAAESAARLVPR
jgi:hypothetical protein